MTAEYKKDFLLNVFFIASVLGIIVLISRYMLAYLFPFIIGVIVAFAVQKPAGAISCRINIKKQICAVILTLTVCAVFFAALITAVWALGNKLGSFIGLMPEYFANLQKTLNNIKENIVGGMQNLGAGQKNTFENLFSNMVNSALSGVMQFVSSLAASIIKNLPKFLVSSIVTVVASCYIAKDFDRLKKFAVGILPPAKVKKLADIKSVLFDNSAKFIKGYAIICTVTFAELSAAFLILGVKNPIIVAFTVALVDILPVLGVGTVLLPWAVIELLSQNMRLGFGLLAAYAVIAVVRNFAEPRIIGNQMGINPIFTLLSMFLGLKIAGVTGMILFPLSLTVTISYYKKTMSA